MTRARDKDGGHARLVKKDGEDRGIGRRKRGSVTQYLGRAILAGEYKPGDILSGEVAHSTVLGVSRGAYREAVQALIAKGLVESKPKTGTCVLPRDRWNILDPDVLAWAFSGTPDIRLLRSLFELRSAIEPFAARLGVNRRPKRTPYRRAKETPFVE